MVELRAGRAEKRLHDYIEAFLGPPVGELGMFSARMGCNYEQTP